MITAHYAYLTAGVTMDSAISGIVVLSVGAIIPIVNRLTKQELWVLCVVFSLLLVGLAVKTWREAHPSPGVTQSDNH